VAVTSHSARATAHPVADDNKIASINSAMLRLGAPGGDMVRPSKTGTV
jgi:hypothetical protein